MRWAWISPLVVFAALLVACSSEAPKELPLDEAIAPPGAGYEELQDPFGPFDIERYVNTFSDSECADRAALAAAGFREGIARGWADEQASRALAVFVFQARDEESARVVRDYFANDVRTRKGATDFAVPEVQQGVGLSYLEDVEEGQERVNTVLFVQRARLYVVASQDVDPAADEGLVRALAQQQARLGA